MSSVGSGMRSFLRGFSIFQSVHRYIAYRPRPLFLKHRDLFLGREGVEIGGPSHIFGAQGALPVYPIVSRLDNVNYSSRTFWSQRESDEKYRVEGREVGRSFVLDSSELGQLPDESYDFLLASHVIEHLANPLRALEEWRRVLRVGGAAIIIAPDRRRTYDRKRSVTSLAHLLQDYRNDVDESDTTHQEEVVTMHDVSMDGTVTSLEQHVLRTRANAENRIMHHHVFDEKLLIQAAREVGFEVQASAVYWPYHIVALLRKRSQALLNEANSRRTA